MVYMKNIYSLLSLMNFLLIDQQQSHRHHHQLFIRYNHFSEIKPEQRDFQLYFSQTSLLQPLFVAGGDEGEQDTIEFPGDDG